MAVIAQLEAVNPTQDGLTEEDMSTPDITHPGLGALARVFASDEAHVSDRVQGLRPLIDLVLESGIARLDVLVWADPAYPWSDCGHTAAAVQTLIDSYDLDLSERIFVHEFVDGRNNQPMGPYCDILNEGFEIQERAGIHHTLVISTEVAAELTATDITEMARYNTMALVTGAVVGDENLRRLIAEEGLVANTCALWNTAAVLAMGGFGPLGRRPAPSESEQPPAVEYIDPSTGETKTSPRWGVEEIALLIKFVESSGAVIAIYHPENEVPYAVQDTDAHAAHQDWKMGSKHARQIAMAEAMGTTLSKITDNIIPQDTWNADLRK